MTAEEPWLGRGKKYVSSASRTWAHRTSNSVGSGADFLRVKAGRRGRKKGEKSLSSVLYMLKRIQSAPSHRFS